MCGKGSYVMSIGGEKRWGYEELKRSLGRAYAAKFDERVSMIRVTGLHEGMFNRPVAHIYDSNDRALAYELVDRANEAVAMRKVSHFMCEAIRKSPLGKDKDVMRFVRKLEAFDNSMFDLRVISSFADGLVLEAMRKAGYDLPVKAKPAKGKKKGKKKAKPRKAAWKEIRYK